MNEQDMLRRDALHATIIFIGLTLLIHASLYWVIHA